MSIKRITISTIGIAGIMLVGLPLLAFAVKSQTIPNETVGAIPYAVPAGTGTGGGNFVTDNFITFATSTGLNVSSSLTISGLATFNGGFSQLSGLVSLASTTINGQATTTNLSITSLTAGSILFAGTNGFISQSNTNFFWSNSNSRLGINTATPLSALNVSSTPPQNASGTLVLFGGLPIQGGSASGTFLGINPTIFNGDFLNFQVNSSTKFSVNNTGTVTIGSNLSVTGNTTTTNLTISGISGLTQCLRISSTGVVSGAGSDCGLGTVTTSSAITRFNVPYWSTTGGALAGSSTLSYSSSTGYFHTASGTGFIAGDPIREPFLLSSVGTNNSTGVGDLGLMGFINLGTTTNNTAGFQFAQENNSGTVQTVAGFDLVGVSHTTGAQSAALAFATRNAGSFAERFRLSAAGNLSIGTTTENGILNANGNIFVNGNTTTTNLTVSGISGSTQCLRVNTSGVVSGTSNDCPTASGTSGQMAFFTGTSALGSSASFSVVTSTGTFVVSSTSTRNLFIGSGSGASISTSNDNVFLGFNTGNSSGIVANNTFIGASAGKVAGGSGNTFIGSQSGLANSAGSDVTLLGYNSGLKLTSGNDNVFLGRSAGETATIVNRSVFIGKDAGFQNTTSSDSVFIGYQAGYKELNSGRLYISNSSTTTPLIFGNFASSTLGFGTSAPSSTVHIMGASGQTRELFRVASSTGTKIFSVNSSSTITLGGHLTTTGTAPTLSSCGTGPSISGNDQAGTVTGGTSSTGCTLTFATAYVTTPHCVVTPQTGSTTNAFSYTVSTTTIVTTQTGFGTNKFDYLCME